MRLTKHSYTCSEVENSEGLRGGSRHIICIELVEFYFDRYNLTNL